MQQPHIDDYSFGQMVIDGTRHSSDLIIRSDGTVTANWWRQEGHNLVPADITGVLETEPELLLVGTGASGMMRVSEEVQEECRRRGIRLESGRTATAATRYNEEADGDSSVAACFHLTC